MAVTAEELAAINYVRAAQHRPPLAAHEVEALSYEPAPQAGPVAAAAPPSAEEAAALAYIRDQQRRAAGQTKPAAPAPAVPPAPRPVHAPAAPATGASAVDPAALAAAGVGGPLTSAEASLLAEISAEYVADGAPAMTPAKALAIVVQRRRRAA